jgi:hypothetical protein
LWELLVHTPAVFVRVANKGVTGYGTWKRVRKMGDRERLHLGTFESLNVEETRGGRKIFGLKEVTRQFS